MLVRATKFSCQDKLSLLRDITGRLTTMRESRKVTSQEESYRYIRVTAFEIRKTPITNCYKRDDCPRHLVTEVIRVNAYPDIVTTGLPI